MCAAKADALVTGLAVLRKLSVPPPSQRTGEDRPRRRGGVLANLARVIEEGGRALAAYIKPREDGSGTRSWPRRSTKSSRRSAKSRNTGWPTRSARSNCRLARQGLSRLWASAAKRLAGEATDAGRRARAATTSVSPKEWSSNQFFDFLEQAYLLATRWADQMVSEAAELDPHTKQKAEFYVRQIGNALSPSNFVLTNPELLRETLTSNAENLVRGMHMLADDVEAGGGDLRIRQSDSSMFAVGRNLGGYAGQGHLSERDHAAPAIRAVHSDGAEKSPLLIIPPWINKFYVLDLTPEKSFIKWCVDQGITVFCISWVNPDAHLAKKSWDDYVREGPLAALAAIKDATGEDQVTCHRLLRRRHHDGGRVGGHGGEARPADRFGDVLCRTSRFHLCRRSQSLRR